MKPASTLVAFLIACVVPASAGAQGGTLQFVGALVEPTCSADVLDDQPTPRQLVVRLHACLVPASQAAHATSGAAGPEAQVVGALHTVALPEVVAQAAGRDSIEALTVSYH